MIPVCISSLLQITIKSKIYLHRPPKKSPKCNDTDLNICKSEMRIRAATSGKAVAVNTAVRADAPNTPAALITPNCNDLYLFDYFKIILTAFNVGWNIKNRRSKGHTEQFQSHPY